MTLDVVKEAAERDSDDHSCLGTHSCLWACDTATLGNLHGILPQLYHDKVICPSSDPTKHDIGQFKARTHVIFTDISIRGLWCVR